MTRRDLLSGFARGALGAGLYAAGIAGGAKRVSANDKIVVAHVGVGGMGNGHVAWFAGFPDVETAAICDVDSTHRDATLDRLRKMRPETKAKGYRDFREVLDRDDIDVVTCATPDHWHALIAILAFQAGKDVYGEKPLSHTFAESRAMLANQRRYGRIYQLGTQIHAGDNYHRVVELVRSGVLGKIHTVRVWKAGGYGGMGFQPEQDPPATLDWDFWLGPAPWRRYTPARCHGSFRNFWDYSGGMYADFWCHIADLAFWALDLGAPRTIDARGEAPNDGIGECPVWIDVDYEFEGLKLLWTSSIPDVPGAKGRGIGCQFVGDRGQLVADYGSRVLFIDGKQMEDVPEVPKTIPRSPGHQRNFLDCVRSRNQPESNLDHAARLTLPMYLGCISFRLGRKLTWNAEKQEFEGDAAANRMLSQPYRAPWYLPL